MNAKREADEQKKRDRDGHVSAGIFLGESCRIDAHPSGGQITIDAKAGLYLALYLDSDAALERLRAACVAAQNIRAKIRASGGEAE